ncbi:hypothetical protein CHH80_22015 [Bacillus sp. 7504-2]|nr:hypothetical protein CHH80_22015 [Bacillus sp. 7504-2]
MDYIFISGFVLAFLFFVIALFQVLLSLGYPLGEYAMGGYYKVLPHKLRIVSVFNALILLFMSIVILEHVEVLTVFHLSFTNTIVWVFTLFLGLNTIANLLSTSRKEKYTMTPLSSIAFVLSLVIAIS